MQTITVKHKIKTRKENDYAIRKKIGEIEKPRSTVAAKSTVWFIHNNSKNKQLYFRRIAKMKRFTLLFAVLLMMIGVAQIFAAGTPAGTIIKNWATGNYKDANGNAMTPVNSDTVSTTVSQVAGVNVDPDGNKTLAHNSFVDYAVTITNTGNGDDTFSLGAGTITTGSSSFSETIYFDANRNGVKDAGETTVTSSTGALNADSSYYVVVRVAVTGGAHDEVATTTVTGTSTFNGGVNDTATLTSDVTAALITGTIQITDDNTPAPGQAYTYRVDFQNDGDETAYSTTLSLPVPANTQYVAGSMTLNGGTLTDGSGDDEGTWAAGSGTIVVGSLAASGSGYITYQVRVNTGVASGTVITNTVDIDYDDSIPLAYTTVQVSTSGASNATVSQEYGIFTEVADDSLEGDPSDDVTFSIKVKNTGNGTDDYDITKSGGLGWTWVYYPDDNNDGTPDGAAITNTGSISAGDSTYILARVSIPAGTADETVDETDVTFTSTGNGSVSSTETLTTTVTAPVLSLSKTVLPTGNQPPQTVLTYSVVVTNNGTGEATQVVVTDNIPSNTTYEGSSLTINGAPKTDGTGDDEASCDGTTATFNLGTMASGASATVSFQVKID